MIQFRCDRSSIVNPFPAETVAEIYKYTAGVPRPILRVCSHAWNLARNLQYRTVVPDLIASAVSEAVMPGDDKADEVAETAVA
jgi:hypothetical protein